LEPGDQVLVPARVGAGGTAGTDAVAVLGAVRIPGNYPVGNGLSLTSVLAQAGGPVDGAKIHKIRLQSLVPEGQQVTVVDLRATLERGEGLPPVVKPGDIVYLPPGGTFAGRAFGAALQLLAATASFIVIYDWVKDQ
jgi:protein involved in polysaccharide export with SLBB domain